jgi:hypothetical protein
MTLARLGLHPALRPRELPAPVPVAPLPTVDDEPVGSVAAGGRSRP